MHKLLLMLLLPTSRKSRSISKYQGKRLISLDAGMAGIVAGLIPGTMVQLITTGVRVWSVGTFILDKTTDSAFLISLPWSWSRNKDRGRI